MQNTGSFLFSTHKIDFGWSELEFGNYYLVVGYKDFLSKLLDVDFNGAIFRSF